MTDPPTVPEKVTRIAYWAAFALAAAALLIDGLAPLWWPQVAEQLTDTAAVIVEVVVLIAAGLGAIPHLFHRTHPKP